MIDSALAERVGQEEVGGCHRRMTGQHMAVHVGSVVLAIEEAFG